MNTYILDLLITTTSRCESYKYDYLLFLLIYIYQIYSCSIYILYKCHHHPDSSIR